MKETKEFIKKLVANKRDIIAAKKAVVKYSVSAGASVVNGSFVSEFINKGVSESPRLKVVINTSLTIKVYRFKKENEGK